MDIRDKIVKSFSETLDVQYVRLEDDDGISGFVVSPRFQGVSTMDRQGMIEDALSNASVPLTTAEKRQILMIAGLTPDEYENVGTRVRVHRIKEVGGGGFEILLHGSQSDAEYVRGAIKNQKGVQTTDPKQVPGAVGILMSFQVKRTGATPLTKAGIARVLKNDQYIRVLPNA